MGGSRTFHTPLGALIDSLSGCTSRSNVQATTAMQASARCSDDTTAKLVSVEVIGREEPLTTAIVTKRMARWLFEEVDAEEAEQTGVA